MHSKSQSIWLNKMRGDQQIDHFFRDRPLDKCWGGGILRDATFFFVHVRWKSFFKLL